MAVLLSCLNKNLTFSCLISAYEVILAQGFHSGPKRRTIVLLKNNVETKFKYNNTSSLSNIIQTKINITNEYLGQMENFELENH